VGETTLAKALALLLGPECNRDCDRIKQAEYIPLSALNRLYHQLRCLKTVQQEILRSFKEGLRGVKQALK